MDKKERVQAALEGRMDSVDRPPASVWYHFGTHFLDGKFTGALEADYFRHYDWDFLKMMNDHPWPLPARMSAVSKPEDLGRFTRLSMEEEPFTRQFAALREACARVAEEAFVVDTVFNPFGIARRTLKKHALRFMREAPHALLGWLEQCTENLAAYIREAARTGIRGIFLSVNGADSILLTDAEFERFVKPFDLMVLEAARSVGPLIIGHIHGANLAMDRVLSYPVAALNWSHLHDNEGFAPVRARTKTCLIGGMDEIGTSQLTPEDISRSVLEAYRDSRGGGFIAGPGCAVPPDIAPDLIRAPRIAVERLARR